jgi:hypothetical protein
MTTPPQVEKVGNRYVATCPVCNHHFTRASREAAQWLLSQHVAYTHDGQPVAP